MFVDKLEVGGGGGGGGGGGRYGEGGVDRVKYTDYTTMRGTTFNLLQ